jgi:TPR repeat protein
MRIVVAVALAASTMLLQGCLAGLIVAQAVPAAMGGVAMANTENRSPFVTRMPNQPARTDAELAALDAQLLAAACGDANAQFWLGSALHNGFNTSPDPIEIYKWYRLAQHGGVGAATPELERLAAGMSEAQIAQAKLRVSQWRVREEGCAPRG